MVLNHNKTDTHARSNNTEGNMFRNTTTSD